MICGACQTDYNLQSHKWNFEGKGNQGEGRYVVQSNVFTSKILERVLERVVLNQFTEISVDAFLAEYEQCEGCQLCCLYVSVSKSFILLSEIIRLKEKILKLLNVYCE